MNSTLGALRKMPLLGRLLLLLFLCMGAASFIAGIIYWKRGGILFIGTSIPIFTLVAFIVIARKRPDLAAHRIAVACGAVALPLIIGAIALGAISNNREMARRQAIIYDTKRLIDDCKLAGTIGSVEVRGRILVWDMASDTESRVYRLLPPELQAYSFDSPITILMIIGTREVQVGTYSISKEPAYRQITDAAIVYWPERKAVGVASIVSREPISTRSVTYQPEYGDPNQPVANWLTSLPRVR